MYKLVPFKPIHMLFPDCFCSIKRSSFCDRLYDNRIALENPFLERMSMFWQNFEDLSKSIILHYLIADLFWSFVNISQIICKIKILNFFALKLFNRQTNFCFFFFQLLYLSHEKYKRFIQTLLHLETYHSKRNCKGFAIAITLWLNSLTWLFHIILRSSVKMLISFN